MEFCRENIAVGNEEDICSVLLNLKELIDFKQKMLKEVALF